MQRGVAIRGIAFVILLYQVLVLDVRQYFRAIRCCDLLDHIAHVFRDDDTVDPEKVMRAVFKVLARHITAGEIENVKHLLPKSLQELWP